MKLKRTVTVEIDRVKITKSCDSQNLIWCEICQAETEFISRTETVELLKVMQLQNLDVCHENLHLYQPDETQTLVCLSSIINGNYTRSK